jgi:hypothetical protein
MVQQNSLDIPVLRQPGGYVRPRQAITVDSNSNNLCADNRLYGGPRATLPGTLIRLKAQPSLFEDIAEMSVRRVPDL